MKKNSLFSTKSLITLASVLSVLLLFSGVCVGVLWILGQMHVVRFPDIGDGTDGASEKDPAVSLPVFTETEAQSRLLISSVSTYEELICQAPFTDNFYLKLRVSQTESASPAPGTYEIWRFGDRYRINRYSEQDEVEYMITCDGERVMAVDFSAMDVSYYLMAEGYSFGAVSPLPDFTRLLQSEHEIFEYTETDTLCIAACEYPELETVDETQIFKSTGFLRSYKRMQKGKTVLTIDVLSTDASFVFNEGMFEIH